MILMNTTTKTNLVTKLPYRLEPFGDKGWTVSEFKSAKEAADFFQAYQSAAMPCWKRMGVINGELTLVR
jgi:hypothetical protein